MAEILKGAAVTAALNTRMQAEVAALREEGIEPTLAILRVGEREDDVSYERGATKRCASVGVNVKNFIFPTTVTQEELMATIDKINADNEIHGVLIFRPLPKHLDEEAVRGALAPAKDIDGITDGSLAGVFTGSGEGFPTCTAQACMEILEHYNIDLTGKRAVVIGRSLVVGKPVSIMLMAKHATVTTCHTRTVDMAAVAREAEVLIVAAGKAGAVDASFLSPGQVVIDVGIHVTEEGKLCGDVKFEEAEPIVAAITPVPGGVGTVTTSILVSHVIKAAQRTLAK